MALPSSCFKDWTYSINAWAGFGHAVEGLRLALDKLLFDRDVAGFFEIGELRA